MQDESRLNDVRARIDLVDRQLLSLFNQRAGLAEEVARLKRASGDTVFYRPEREAEVLNGVAEANPGPLPNATVVRLFRELMSACLALESPLRVAYLGPAGTYSQDAVKKHFGQAVECVPLAGIDLIFREVAAGEVDYGIVPIENSTEGAVTHTLDSFLDSSLKICGEVELPIHHRLLSNAASFKEIGEVYSHKQSLAQCRQWLAGHLPEAELVAVSSNAEAAQRVAEEPGSAAIAGESAAIIYGLPVLASNIEDTPDNTTRFLVLGRQETRASGHDKTTLMVATHNKPGALHALLGPLAEHGISMSRIESRPSRLDRWTYVFFIDVDGHASDPGLSAALAQLQREASLFRVLGSYPRNLSVTES
ncbi:MAG: prephenate dehydratase [Gammaproteobacteria bacterium]|nr:prephenate dehydratase [Gammaproteobacteria bacterium]